MNLSELIRKQAIRQGLSPRTIRTYQICVEQFFRKCQKDPFFINKKDIQDYLLEKNAPGNTLNVHLNALKFFYEKVLQRKLTVNIKYSKTPRHLPEFLTQEETFRILQVIVNPKHKLAIALLYSAGLRISELLNLKVRDFQFEQDYGWVRQGKGNKDRPFIVAQKLNEELQMIYTHLAAPKLLHLKSPYDTLQDKSI